MISTDVTKPRIGLAKGLARAKVMVAVVLAAGAISTASVSASDLTRAALDWEAKAFADLAAIKDRCYEPIEPFTGEDQQNAEAWLKKSKQDMPSLPIVDCSFVRKVDGSSAAHRYQIDEEKSYYLDRRFSAVDIQPLSLRKHPFGSLNGLALKFTPIRMKHDFGDDLPFATGTRETTRTIRDDGSERVSNLTKVSDFSFGSSGDLWIIVEDSKRIVPADEDFPEQVYDISRWWLYAPSGNVTLDSSSWVGNDEYNNEFEFGIFPYSDISEIVLISDGKTVMHVTSDELGTLNKFLLSFDPYKDK